jgi:hypothetical protein
MNFTENEFRDFLFNNYRSNLSSIIIGRRDPIEITGEEFPSIHLLLQQKAEEKINDLLSQLESLLLTAKELRLVKEGDSTTRIDLFGISEETGLTIIELKKSDQTERQAFTELLAYANHFCTLFPGVNEHSITSILVSPMQARIIRDSFAQELIINHKNIIALVPTEVDGEIRLKVHYPKESSYHWVENNLLHDSSMSTVAISFQTLEGFIDTDVDSDKQIPDYSKEALNTISSSISQALEANGIHGFVYASQKWGEIACQFPFPNTIFVVAINPFSSWRTFVTTNKISGQSNEERLVAIQAIHDQLSDDAKENWLELIESDFLGNLIKIVEKEFNLCLKGANGNKVGREISIPSWYGIKSSMIDAVCTHNLDIFLTGLLREIYSDYIKHVYATNFEHFFYSDDIPAYAYKMVRNWLAVWLIISGLGFGNEGSDEENA